MDPNKPPFDHTPCFLIEKKQEPVVEPILCFGCSKVFDNDPEFNVHVCRLSALNPRINEHVPFTLQHPALTELRSALDPTSLGSPTITTRSQGSITPEQLSAILDNEIVPNKDGQYTCCICQKLFDKRRNLRRHYPIHAAIRLYACDECKRTFRRSDHLKSHIKSHSN